MSLPVPRLRSRASARLLLWWLVLAMLMAPALGRIHQVVHPSVWSGAAASGAHAPTAGHAHVHRAATQDAHWLLALFKGHSHSDCQLHDQLNAWASGPALGQNPPAALPQELPCQLEARTASAGSAAFFDPRAPPAAAA